MPISLAKPQAALRPTWEVLKAAFAGFHSDNASLMGAGVAFWAVLSLSPMLVIMLVVVSFAYDAETARHHIEFWLERNVGGELGESIRRLLQDASAPGATTLPGIASLLLMLWSATRMFHALQTALNRIWHVRTKRRRLHILFLHVLRKRAMTFALLISVALLLFASVTLTTVMPVIRPWLGNLGADYDVYRALELVFTTIVLAVGVGLVYVILPDARIPWRFAWRGAALTGGLLTLGKLALSWYLSRQSLGSYGAASSVVALLLWVFFSTQVFFFGAEVTQAYARIVGWPREPEPIADRPPDARLEDNQE